MSNVTLQIAGRRYTVACAEGEEPHIETLGASIDAKLSAMPGMTSQSEPRTLLFAALLLADELHETRRELGIAARIGEPLENLAERLEDLASRLESRGPST